MQNREWFKEINIYELLIILKDKFIWIALTAVIFGMASWLISTQLIAPKYTSSVTMYVYSNSDRTSSDYSISSADITASKSLVDTYIIVLKSKTVLNEIIEKMNLNMSYSELYNSISATSVNNTEVFSVSVINKDPQLAADIANEIAEIAPDEIIQVVKAGGVEIIDYAEVSKNPTTPNIILNVIYAVILGLLLSYCVFLIHKLLDTRVSSKSDITNIFSYPVLGEIPKIEINKQFLNSEGEKRDVEK